MKRKERLKGRFFICPAQSVLLSLKLLVVIDDELLQLIPKQTFGNDLLLFIQNVYHRR